MTDKTFWTAAALIAIVAGGYYFGIKKPDEVAKATKRAEHRDRERAKAQSEWAAIDKTIKLSETEDLRTVRFPDQMMPDVPYLAVDCFIYRNAEYKTATFWCPNEIEKAIRSSD